MENWSFSTMAKSRIVWINFMRVPLCRWNSEFFLQIGKEVGEPLLIDDDTLFKRRFHKERMLVLIKHGSSYPKYINVNGGRGSFRLMVEEDVSPVELQWIESFLELVDRNLKR